MSEQLPLPNPLMIGPYKFLRKIGHGGMGEVFLVEDPINHNSIALKKMLPRIQDNKLKQEQFLNEARLSSKLNHPGIIPILSIVNDTKLIYYTMPFIEGKTIKKILVDGFHQAEKGLPTDIECSVLNLAPIFLQVCKTVAYIHSQGLIHGDITPSNIIIQTNGNMYLLDLGLVKHINERIEIFNESNSVSGTIGYLAPEQIRGLLPTYQSEIYSLGLILYEILTLRFPFHRNDIKTYSNNWESEALIDPAKVAPSREIPSFLSNIALKCLNPSIKERYSNVQGIVQDFEEGWIKFNEIKNTADDCKIENTAADEIIIISKLFPENDKFFEAEPEFHRFEEALKSLNAFNLSGLQKNLCDQLVKSSDNSRIEYYKYALLAFHFLTPETMTVQAYGLLEQLKIELRPIPFIDENRVSPWPEKVKQQALAIHLAFLLEKPRILIKLFEDICSMSNYPFSLIGQIIMALLKLGELNLAKQLLKVFTSKFLDVQAIAYFSWIKEALEVYQTQNPKINFLNEFPKKIIHQHLLPLFLILDDAIVKENTTLILTTVNQIINYNNLDPNDLAKLDVYFVWACLLEKNWSNAEAILEWHLKKGNQLEAMSFLRNCMLYATRNVYFSLPEITLKHFFWEKTQIYKKYVLFYHLSGDSEKKEYYRSLLSYSV